MRVSELGFHIVFKSYFHLIFKFFDILMIPWYYRPPTNKEYTIVLLHIYCIYYQSINYLCNSTNPNHMRINHLYPIIILPPISSLPSCILESSYSTQQSMLPLSLLLVKQNNDIALPRSHQCPSHTSTRPD